MLAISDLNVHYGMHEALQSVNLQVASDEIVVILGANGAGKSTLLSAVAGSCAGDVDGDISLNGQSLLGLDTAQLVEHGIAFVPEGRGVFGDLSVQENLQLGSYSEHARHNEDANRERVLSLFPKLDERRKQIVRTMSGGEQQMVAIGRALMSSPSILMLDEPSLGLSPLLCKELFSSLKQVRDSGVGILLVEQNAKQSLSIADRGYLLGNGKIIGENNAESLLNDPAVQAAYLGGATTTQLPVAPQSTLVREQTDSQPSADVPVTPVVSRKSTTTQPSDALLDEDVDSLVARATSTASQLRGLDSNLPPHVIKLSSNNAANGAAASNNSSAVDASKSITGMDLPATQNAKVQAMLGEFELAAKNAAAGSTTRTTVNELTSAKTHTEDDPFSLPHIPVYKKSSVTVYRRDGTGKLRKQEKP